MPRVPPVPIGSPAGAPQDVGEHAKSVPLAEPVAQLPVALDGALHRPDGLIRLVGQVALVRATLQQLGPLIRRQDVAEPQRPAVLRRRFAVGAERRCLRPRSRRIAKHSHRIVGCLSVMGEPGQVRRTAGGLHERSEHRLVQRGVPTQRKRVLDDSSGELVAECDPARLDREHACRVALVEAL